MAGFVKGEVLVLPFPFSDLSGSKRRPALVLADLPGDDIILCQITSQDSKDSLAVALASSDFAEGSLPVSSFIRPSRIFTADKSIIIRKAGKVRKAVVDNVTRQIIKLIE